jgi:hypothetical protein
MAHLLNLNNKKTEFPNNLNEDVDSKQSHQDKDTSGSTTLDSKKMSSSEKSAQKKIPIIIPKLKIHSPLAMKIPISPRALKSPKRNPEEKKQLPEKKEEFIDIEEIKKNFAEEWSAQNEQDLDVDNKKNDNSISTASEIIKKMNRRLSSIVHPQMRIFRKHLSWSGEPLLLFQVLERSIKIAEVMKMNISVQKFHHLHQRFLHRQLPPPRIG